MPQRDPNAYRAYMRAYMKRRWRLRRKVAIKFLGGKCVSCRTTKRLQFDHKNRKTKVASIAKLSSASEERFWAEVKKCQLLCYKCHLVKSRPELSEVSKAREDRKRRLRALSFDGEAPGSYPEEQASSS